MKKIIQEINMISLYGNSMPAWFHDKSNEYECNAMFLNGVLSS